MSSASRLPGTLRRGILWVAGAVWLAVCVAAPASAQTVAIVVSDSAGPSGELAEALQADLRKAPGVRHQLVLSTRAALEGREPLALPADTVLVVAVGTQASRAALAGEARADVLSVMVPRFTFEALAGKARGTPGRRLSAVFVDQPVARQAELVRQLFPARSRVGLLVGPALAGEADAIRQQLEARGLALATERVERESELYAALQQLLPASDLLLTVPDPYIVNAGSAQNLLLTSFRWRVPVIGYSLSYVRAGAIAAVYSTPAQIGLDAAEIVRSVSRGQALPAPRYPRQFSVALNEHVAQTLNLRLPTEPALLERLRRQERSE